MKQKRGERGIRITKLTNLFFGVALGMLIGYRGGTLNFILAGVAIVIVLLLAIIYKNER